MERKIKKQTVGFKTQDGAGVNLVRVLGHDTVEDYDPILMLDSFDSTNPSDYTAGFPMHPHRGIETISYVYRGKMVHKDSLGNEDAIADGEVQWMTAGSGILHEEKLPAAPHMLGVQVWLNLPAKDKMVSPAYHSIKNSDIKEIPFDGGMLRLLAGQYGEKRGYQSRYLPFDYYDVHLEPNASLVINTERNRSVMVFTLVGDAMIGNQPIQEKTAARLTEGDSAEIKSGPQGAQVLFISAQPVQEPIAWGGPIVMNTKAELQQAFTELNRGTFLKKNMNYEKIQRKEL